MSHRIQLCVRATLAAALPLVTSTVFAQELQEVVVTAQKREQNVQNVPIAITAFTADTLQSKGITDIHSLSNLTPNVNLDSGAPFSGDSSVLSASIRGIGQDDFAFNLDPGVGVYLDGVYLARTIGANQNLLDVERIEIAKGPQGTLFGRNTIGGAISIVTHTPGTERKFTAQATTGRYDRRDFSFTADLPVSDKVLTSLTGSWLKRDGYQEVIPFPSSVPFVTDPVRAYPKAGYDTADENGGVNQQVLRGKLLWNASDSFSLTVAADWQHQDQSATPSTVLSVQTAPENAFGFFYNTCISNDAATLSGMGLGLVCGVRAVVPGISTGAPPLAGTGYVNGPGGNSLLSNSPHIYWNFPNTQTGSIDKTYSTGVSFAKNDAFGVAVTGDWQLGDGLSFKSITGYRQINWRVGVDLDGLPEQIQEVTDHQHQYQVSQEFQLNGTAFGDKLNYVTGLYYFKEAGYVHDYVPFEGLLFVYDYANDVDTKSYAAYFHTDYKLTDAFSVTLGGRYSREQKHFIGGQADLNGFGYKISGCYPPEDSASLHLDPNIPAAVTCQQALGFPVEGQPLRYFPTGTNEQIFNVFTPKIGFQYQFTKDVMAYASWSKGFKSGGWTTRLSTPIMSGDEAEFGPEFAKTSELGLKSELFERRLLVNTAIFYTDYDGIQLNFQEGASPVLHNAGNARIKGIEVESQAILGAGFSFNLAGGYIDAKYTKIAPEVGIPITSKLPKTPRYKYTIGPNYDFSLSNGAGMRFSVDYTRTADLFNDSLNTPELHRPATNSLGASIHYLAQDSKYEIILGGTNLTNDRWLQSGSINLAAGEKVGTYNRPLEWYLTGRVKFGAQ